MDWQTLERRQKRMKQRSMVRRRKSVFVMLMIVCIWVYFVPIVQEAATTASEVTTESVVLPQR